MPPFIDIHCHLDYIEEPEKAVENAKKAGVSVILTNGTYKETIEKTKEFEKKFPEVKACLGYYPPDANQNKKFDEKEFETDLKSIEENKDRIIAVGEIGMDFYHGKEEKLQQEVFEKQLKLAKKLKKPVIIHSRKAEAQVLEVLREQKQKKVLLHCFGGKKALIKEGIEAGYFFSISTNVVRSDQTQTLAKLVPLNRLFIETDAPFLSPFKDKPNEPAFVVGGYKKVAELKGVTLEELKNAVWMNYQELFQ